MTWEEFQDICGNSSDLLTRMRSNREITNIECPNCGAHLYKRTDIALRSYPPKYQYECDCGFVGYAIA